MHFLELILVVILSPFWFPILLMLIGIAILVFGILMLVFLGLSLILIAWILQNLYNFHIELVNVRQVILTEIKNGLNSKMSWLRFMRLVYIKYLKQTKEIKAFKKQYIESQNQDEKFDD